MRQGFGKMLELSKACSQPPLLLLRGLIQFHIRDGQRSLLSQSLRKPLIPFFSRSWLFAHEGQDAEGLSSGQERNSQHAVPDQVSPQHLRPFVKAKPFPDGHLPRLISLQH